MDINVDLLEWFKKILMQKLQVGKLKIISNKVLAEELRKPIIRKLEKSKVYSAFIYNILGADPVDIQLISKFNKGFRFLLCFINTYKDKKDKKGITITNAFQNFLNELNHKPNKIWVDKDIEFYNSSMRSFLPNNDL